MYNVRKMRCCFIHLSPLLDHLRSIKHLYPLQKLPQFILRYSDNVFGCRHVLLKPKLKIVSRDSNPDGTCGRMQGTYSGNDQNMGTFLYTIPYPGYIFVVPDATKINSALLFYENCLILFCKNNSNIYMTILCDNSKHGKLHVLDFFVKILWMFFKTYD